MITDKTKIARQATEGPDFDLAEPEFMTSSINPSSVDSGESAEIEAVELLVGTAASVLIT